MTPSRKMHMDSAGLRSGAGGRTCCGAGRGLNLGRVLDTTRHRDMVSCKNCLRFLRMIDHRPVVRGSQGELLGGAMNGLSDHA